MYFTGWTPNRPESDKYRATLGPIPNVEGYSHLAREDKNEDVFAWDIEEKVFGKRLATWDQADIGSCVSMGYGRAAQDVLLVQVASGQSEWPGAEVAREPIYGGSRVEVGGETWGEGSVGAWAAKWLMQWGLLFYLRYDQLDLTSGYSVPRCREYGKRGVPDTIEPTAKKFPVKEVKVVDTPAGAWNAIGSMYFVSICGSISRTTKRDKQGFCRKTGNEWNHCQELAGRCTVKGGRRAFAYRNSWGGYLGDENDRVQLESGREITLPPGCYLADYDEIAEDLRQGDSHCLADVAGMPARSISWLI